MSENSNKSISKQVIILATPIIFSNLSRVAMGLADMAMVSRLGATALAATGMGSVLFMGFPQYGNRCANSSTDSEFTQAWSEKDILSVVMPCITALFWPYVLQFRLLLSEY